jgi:flagellar hook-length control protein FliK
VQQTQTAAPTPTIALQAALAAAQPVTLTVPTPNTTTVSASAGDALSAAAVSSTAAVESESADLAGGVGQMSFAQSGGTSATNGASAPAAAGQPVTPSQVFDQIKVKITRATKAGLDQVSIQLKPEALGRVDIKLEVAADGKVHATVMADKQETLNLLQNDSQGLERALQDAGLRTDANSLEFSLRGDGGAQFAADNQNASGAAAGNGAVSDTDPSLGPSYDYTLAAQQRGGVDTYA